MAVYEFRGLNTAGKTITGLKEADSPKTLRTLLKKEGVFLTDVVGQSEGKSNRAALKGAAAGVGKSAGEALNQDINLRRLTRGGINTDDIAIMTRQLATLLGAGVALVEALAALVDQVDKERLKVVLSDIKQRVNEGSALADAMTHHERVFGKLYINMVRAGEHSGALDAVLVRLAEFTESQARLKQRVIGTMIYPLVMLVFGGGIMVLLLTVVVPKVTKIFADMKVALPWTTRLLIGSSNFMQDWWFVIFPIVIGSAVMFLRWTRSEKGKPVWDRVLLKLPVVGGLVRMLAVARFTRTLATLLKSGVPLLTAMDIVRNVVTNQVLADVVDKARDSIREGESIAAPLKRSGEFPPLVYHMVAIGERSGQLEDMLVNVADSYESQVNVRIGALTSLLEPIMIVAMAGGVGFVAFSILMPILQMNSAIH
jgi:general secretion pathway protein F